MTRHPTRGRERLAWRTALATERWIESRASVRISILTCPDRGIKSDFESPTGFGPRASPLHRLATFPCSWHTPNPGPGARSRHAFSPTHDVSVCPSAMFTPKADEAHDCAE